MNKHIERLTLYDYFRSSASFRVRIALNLKKLPYEKIAIHLIKEGGEQFSPTYQKINPQQLVPTLIDKNHVITQSLAIVEYLEETYREIPILPDNIYKKALARSYALSIACDIHPLNNLRVLTYLEEQLLIDKNAKDNWYQYWIKKGLFALEQQLKVSSYVGDFCLGNTPTIADIFLVPQLYNARRFNSPLDDYPILTRIEENCRQIPAFIQSFPEYEMEKQ